LIFRLRDAVAEKEAAGLELQQNIRVLKEQKEQLAEESKAQLEVIESQRLKLNQMELDHDRDVFLLSFIY
jgi:hypothetical protein